MIPYIGLFPYSYYVSKPDRRPSSVYEVCVKFLENRCRSTFDAIVYKIIILEGPNKGKFYYGIHKLLPNEMPFDGKYWNSSSTEWFIKEFVNGTKMKFEIVDCGDYKVMMNSERNFQLISGVGKNEMCINKVAAPSGYKDPFNQDFLDLADDVVNSYKEFSKNCKGINIENLSVNEMVEKGLNLNYFELPVISDSTPYNQKIDDGDVVQCRAEEHYELHYGISDYVSDKSTSDNTNMVMTADFRKPEFDEDGNVKRNNDKSIKYRDVEDGPVNGTHTIKGVHNSNIKCKSLKILKLKPSFLQDNEIDYDKLVHMGYVANSNDELSVPNTKPDIFKFLDMRTKSKDDGGQGIPIEALENVSIICNRYKKTKKSAKTLITEYMKAQKEKKAAAKLAKRGRVAINYNDVTCPERKKLDEDIKNDNKDPSVLSIQMAVNDNKTKIKQITLELEKDYQKPQGPEIEYVKIRVKLNTNLFKKQWDQRIEAEMLIFKSSIQRQVFKTDDDGDNIYRKCEIIVLPFDKEK